MKACGSQLQGEAKTKTASLVETLYGFDSGQSKRGEGDMMDWLFGTIFRQDSHRVTDQAR